MADDHTPRNYRSQDDLSGRGAPSGNASQAVNDPLAELARLIGQNDPFGEYGRNTTRPAATPAEPAYAAPPADPYAQPPGAAHPRDAYVQPAPAAAQRAPGYGAADYSHAAYAEAAPGEVYHPQEPVPGYAHEPYYPHEGEFAGEQQDYYDDMPPPRRRMGVLALVAVFALAVVGTAGAYGYRMMFGSVGSGPPPVIKADSTPSKIAPPQKDSQNAKLINDRVNNGGEQLVSREEQPVDLKDKPAGVLSQDQDANAAPVLGSGVVGTDPKKIQTITIRPDQPSTADPAPDAAVASAPQPEAAAPAPQPVAPPLAVAAPTPEPAPAPAPRHTVARAAPQHTAPQHEARVASVNRNAPLSLSPDAPTSAAPVRATHTASVGPTRLAAAPAAQAGAHGYAVQVSSRRSEAEAQAAMRSVQNKYSSVLSGQPVMVRRVDLGSKGVYYRAMVGPFGSSDAASKLCGSLKAAGGSCFVQRI